MSTLDEQYYISSYTKLSADELETTVILNQPEKKTVAEIEKLDEIWGPMTFSTSLGVENVRSPANIFLLYLKHTKDGWNVQSKEITGARRDTGKASCDSFTIDDYPYPLSLQEGLSVLIAGWEMIKHSKGSIEKLPVGSRAHATIHKQMRSAIQALEDIGLEPKLRLDLSERFSIA